MTAETVTTTAGPAARQGERIYRHRFLTRLTHWLNVLAISMLLMSGLQIFNAHPRLYWGQYGADADRPVVSLTAARGPRHEVIGVTRIGSLTLETTGFLGASKNADGEITPRGFPAWLTLPSYKDLGTGRRWHFFAAWLFVANGLIYLLHTAFSGHFRRDLALSKAEVAPRHILRDIWDHLRLKHPVGEAAKRYNTLQKLAYLAMIFGILPLVVATGLTMSPGVNAALPFLLDLFGGRQSARTLHFICANLIVLFVIVHVVEVFLAGVWNELRSMVTGWYDVRPEPSDGPH
jgi:thiosulfate reductase cytochrome b subunit